MMVILSNKCSPISMIQQKLTTTSSRRRRGRRGNVGYLMYVKCLSLVTLYSTTVALH